MRHVAITILITRSHTVDRRLRIVVLTRVRVRGRGRLRVATSAVVGTTRWLARVRHRSRTRRRGSRRTRTVHFRRIDRHAGGRYHVGAV